MKHRKLHIFLFCLLYWTLESFCAPLTDKDIKRLQRDAKRDEDRFSQTELQAVTVEPPELEHINKNASVYNELQKNLSGVLFGDSSMQIAQVSKNLTAKKMMNHAHVDSVKNPGQDANLEVLIENVDHRTKARKTHPVKRSEGYRSQDGEKHHKLKKQNEGEMDYSRLKNVVENKQESDNGIQRNDGQIVTGIAREANNDSIATKPKGACTKCSRSVTTEEVAHKSNKGPDGDEYAKRTARIVNGQPVLDNGEFPFVVDISNSDEAISSTRFCTGTLIKNDTVLTAAHCVINDGYTSSVFATVGRVELDDNHVDNEPSMTFRSIASMVHPEYDGIGSPKDVAVLLLNESCNAPTVKLAERTPGHGEEAWVVGYGIQRIGTLEEVAQPVEILSGRLQKTKLQVVSRSDCDVPQAELQTKEGLLCTRGVKLGASACMGDSGGGLFKKKHGEVMQVGIVSYGDSQCASEESGVFTDVAHVREWIEYAADRMHNALGPTVQFDLDDRAEIVHKDHIGEKMLVHRGHPSSSHHAKFYTVRTNFSSPRHVRVSLCGGPSEHSIRLSVKNEKDTKVAYEYGACPDGKLSELTLRGMKKDEVIIGVNGNSSMPIRLSFSSSKAK